MAPVAHLDTHVVAWLYAGDLAKIPAAAQSLLQEASLAVSPIVALELAYLEDIGRLTVSSDTILADLAGRIGLAVDDAPFADVVAAASDLSWTRDPFDRLIAAQATIGADTLVTGDATIRENVAATTWR